MSKQEEKGLVPKRRFPEFRDEGEWAVKELGELIYTITPPKKLLTTDYLADGKFPVIDQSQSYICGWTNDDDAIICDHLPLIVFGDHTCILKLVGQPFAQGADGIKIFKPNNSVQTEFLYQSLQVKPLVMEQYKRHFSILRERKVAYPDRKTGEQQKIANCLTAIDELITAQTQKLDVLKAHKKGLMQKLFPAEGEAVPKLRFPEFQDDGEWKENTFGGVATFFNGRAYKQEELLEAGEYRVLRVGNFFSNNEWYYSDLELEDNKYCDNGDLLYAWSASFGPRIWRGEKVIYHYHIWKVVENEGADRKFLFMLLDYETDRMKSRSANGLGLMHITKGTMESWKCYLPKIEEQQKIANCLTSIDDLISNQAQKVEALKSHKKGLMQQLFPAMDEVGA